jgi:hypothetical protein
MFNGRAKFSVSVLIKANLENFYEGSKTDAKTIWYIQIIW